MDEKRATRRTIRRPHGKVHCILRPTSKQRQKEVEAMRVGCGLRVRRIDGNEYLYFWHYERERGRSQRREDYVGPVRESKSRQEAARKLLAYHRRVQQDLGARIARLERAA
jgi:hypothetical protein